MADRLTQSTYEPTQMRIQELEAEVSRLRRELADQNHYAHKLELRLAKEHNAMIETSLKFEEMAGRIVELEQISLKAVSE